MRTDALLVCVRTAAGILPPPATACMTVNWRTAAGRWCWAGVTVAALVGLQSLWAGVCWLRDAGGVDLAFQDAVSVSCLSYFSSGRLLSVLFSAPFLLITTSGLAVYGGVAVYNLLLLPIAPSLHIGLSVRLTPSRAVFRGNLGLPGKRQRKVSKRRRHFSAV